MRTHHLDKVAHLEPEVREYSEQRMKEINAAYAKLRRKDLLTLQTCTPIPAFQKRLIVRAERV